jgi:hypothetical protein
VESCIHLRHRLPHTYRQFDTIFRSQTATTTTTTTTTARVGTMGNGANIPLGWRSSAPGDSQVARTTPEDLRRLGGGVCGVRACDIGLREQHTTLVHISRQADLIEIANIFKVPQYLAHLPSHCRLQPARRGNGAQRTELHAQEFPTGLSRTLNFTCMKLGDFTDLSRSWAPASK